MAKAVTRGSGERLECGVMQAGRAGWPTYCCCPFRLLLLFVVLLYGGNAMSDFPKP